MKQLTAAAGYRPRGLSELEQNEAEQRSEGSRILPKAPAAALSLLHRPHGTVVRSFQADTEKVTQAVFPTLGSKPGTTQPDSPTTGSDTPTKDNRNSFERAPYNTKCSEKSGIAN